MILSIDNILTRSELRIGSQRAACNRDTSVPFRCQIDTTLAVLKHIHDVKVKHPGHLFQRPHWAVFGIGLIIQIIINIIFIIRSITCRVTWVNVWVDNKQPASTMVDPVDDLVSADCLDFDSLNITDWFVSY